jgi:hypothetical protein
MPSGAARPNWVRRANGHGEVAQVREFGARFGIAGELMAFLWSQKLWWMIPLVAVLLVIAALVALASATAIAPFIYPLI